MRCLCWTGVRQAYLEDRGSSKNENTLVWFDSYKARSSLPPTDNLQGEAAHLLARRKAISLPVGRGVFSSPVSPNLQTSVV
jgi:hypothetical protein